MRIAMFSVDEMLKKRREKTI